MLQQFNNQLVRPKWSGDQVADRLVPGSRFRDQRRNVSVPVSTRKQEEGLHDDVIRTSSNASVKRLPNAGLGKLHMGRLDVLASTPEPIQFHDVIQHFIAFRASRTMIDNDHRIPGIAWRLAVGLAVRIGCCGSLPQD
jgi:hypothetical protein